MKFKIGDRIKLTIEGEVMVDSPDLKVGARGTILGIDNDVPNIAVEFDHPFIFGHDLNGFSKYPDRGHYLHENHIELSLIKATKLSKLTYPNAKEKDGYLEI